MRDHLLGCRQFVPDVANEPYYLNSVSPKPYALGIPRRLKCANRYAQPLDTSVQDFETDDQTPKHMREDFPHEYDLKVMLDDATKRHYTEMVVGVDLGADDRFFAYMGPVSGPDEELQVIKPRFFSGPEELQALTDYVKVEVEGMLGLGLKLPRETVAMSRTERVNAAVAGLNMRTPDRAETVAEIMRLKQALRPGRKQAAENLLGEINPARYRKG